MSPTGFKHTGIFPEQGVNWDAYRRIIETAGRPVRVLNLVRLHGRGDAGLRARGRESHACGRGKGIMQWAGENYRLSQLDSTRVRWLVDDAFKFVARELRRGNRYEGILMDPPSYGRGRVARSGSWKTGCIR